MNCINMPPLSTLITKNWGLALGRVGITYPLLPGPFRGKIKINDNQGAAACEKIMSYHMFDLGAYQPFTYASNQYNEYIALCNRAQKPTPEPKEERVGKFCTWVKNELFTSIMPNFMKHWPAKFDAYIKNSNASPSVKAAVQRAHDRLEAQGVNESSVLSHTALYKYTLRKAFIKTENNSYSSPVHTKWKPPRLIQGAQPEFIALVGPTFMTIQAEIKKNWGLGNSIVFTSGVSGRDAANHVSMPGWVVFENDVSSWDASVCEMLCDLECWIAREMGAGRAVVDLMRYNCKTHGRTTHGVVYSIDGTRKSGDPYTSCFNSLLNGLMHLYCFCHDGTPVNKVLPLLRMLVQGDDNLLTFHSSLRPDFNLLLELGFKADNIYRRSIMEAEFCSCHMYKLRNGQYTLGPKLGRLISKLLCFIEPPAHEHCLSLCRGVALGHWAAASFVPGLRCVLERILFLSQGHKVVYPRKLEHHMVFENLPGDDLVNQYWMDRRYFLASTGKYFEKFWSSVVFRDNLLCPANRIMCSKESIADSEFSFTVDLTNM